MARLNVILVYDNQPITSLPVHEQDSIRKAYIDKGPFQPKVQSFPQTIQGGRPRRFVANWFKTHSWLEYSPTTDAAYCFPCYLFSSQKDCQNPFIGIGVSTWNKFTGSDCKLLKHIGKHNSLHNQNMTAWKTLPRVEHSIETSFNRQTVQQKSDHCLRLIASIESTKFIAKQGLAFRGYDETNKSVNRGNFLQLLSLLCQHSSEFNKVCLDNAPKNATMTSPDIQKDILKSMASLVREKIIDQFASPYFCLLVDEARDESTKEQMSLVVRYVDKKGFIQERFIDMIHVMDTSAESLKSAIVSTLDRNGLNLEYVCGQGYDGASNKRGKINGLKSLIQHDVPSAFYIHCFSHRLQLALMSAAKSNIKVSRFFSDLSAICVTVGASCKRADQLREAQTVDIQNAIVSSSTSTGRGLNQQQSLRRPTETRWGSHFLSLCRLLDLFQPTIKVLETIVDDGCSSDSRADASRLLDTLLSFDFVLMLHMLKVILSKSVILSDALQRKDQDILNTLSLVDLTKHELLDLRTENGWSSLLLDVLSFCSDQEIAIPNMDEPFVTRGRPRIHQQIRTTQEHYQVDVFFNVIEVQIQELDTGFPKETSTLLKRIAYLNPNHLRDHAFVSELVELAKMYPNDFPNYDLIMLEQQIILFARQITSPSDLNKIESLALLAVKLVELNMSKTFDLVYRLISLVLTLPISTASSERSFSAMKNVKTRLRNKMGDEFLSDALVLFIEKEFTVELSNDSIVDKFQALSTQRIQLK